MTEARIHPVRGRLTGAARVPHSKPHMQRAILLSLLTNAPSIIVHPAWSSEALGLFLAAQRFGLSVTHRDPGRLVVTGVGRSLGRPGLTIGVEGSAFNFRTVAALACLAPGDTVIEGNASMRTRPVVRYLNFIRDWGAGLEDISDDRHLRIRVRGGRPLGGQTVTDTRHSSQVLTAALLIAPLAERPVTIAADAHDQVGEGYVDLTLAMMREQGAAVHHAGSTYEIDPSVYQSRLHHVASDFTALSYLVGAAATAPDVDLTVAGYYPSALSSESEFLGVMRRLGVRAVHDPVTRSLHVRRTAPEAATIEIDGRNIPTVVPTLAAVAPFVDAAVTVRNVAHVNNHKCRRVEVMIRELTRMGCRITPLFRADGELDGFTTGGGQRPTGGVTLDSHGDHRVFLSLATAAFGARQPTAIDGVQHLHASFPDYPQVMAQLGGRVDAAEYSVGHA